MIPPEIHSAYWSHKFYDLGLSHTARAVLMVEDMEKQFDNNLNAESGATGLANGETRPLSKGSQTESAAHADFSTARKQPGGINPLAFSNLSVRPMQPKSVGESAP